MPRLTTTPAILLLLTTCVIVLGCGRDRRPSEVSITYRQLNAWCGNCGDFELEVGSSGSAVFRGLSSCALPGSHEYRIPAAEVEALVQAFRDAGFFGISRMPRRGGRVFDAGQRVLVYRDAFRIHETVDEGREDRRLTRLAAHVVRVGRIDRFVEPSAQVYRQKLAAGWNVNTTDAQGDTALGCEVSRGDVASARLLLDAGATVHWLTLRRLGVRADPEMTALLASRVDVSGPFVGDALVFAALAGGAALDDLLRRGAHIDALTTKGDTALHNAVRWDEATSLPRIRRLLDAGANPATPDRSGRTALQVASELGKVTAAELLRTREAPDTSDGQRRTP